MCVFYLNDLEPYFSIQTRNLKHYLASRAVKTGSAATLQWENINSSTISQWWSFWLEIHESNMNLGRLQGIRTNFSSKVQSWTFACTVHTVWCYLYTVNCMFDNLSVLVPKPFWSCSLALGGCMLLIYLAASSHCLMLTLCNKWHHIANVCVLIGTITHTQPVY